MPELLQGVKTQASYADATTLGPAPDTASILYSVIGFPCYVQFYKNTPDLPGKFVTEGLDRLEYANTFGKVVSNVAGIQFKDAIPNKHASIFATLSYTTDPSIDDPGTLGPGTIIAGGQSLATAPGTPSDPGAYVSGSGQNIGNPTNIAGLPSSTNVTLSSTLLGSNTYIVTSLSVQGLLLNTAAAAHWCSITLLIGGTIVAGPFVVVVPANTALAAAIPFELDLGGLTQIVTGPANVVLNLVSDANAVLQYQAVAWKGIAVLLLPN